MAPPKHLRIGVFVPGQAQLLDLSPIDIFGMLDPAYLSICKVPAPLVSRGVPSTIHYISLPQNGTHIELTASAFLRISKTINDPEVQPGNLDILLVPGPPPFQPFEKPVLEFLKGHADFDEDGRRTDVLSICTSACLMAQAGVLKGRKVCGTRGIIPELKKMYPDVLWDEERRWVQDGNIWSSGGITNGQEMVGAYLRHNFPGPTTEAVLAMADVGEKGVYYTDGKVSNNVWWLWQILRAVTFGNGKQKKIL